MGPSSAAMSEQHKTLSFLGDEVQQQADNVADYLLEGKDDGALALLTLEAGYTYGQLQTASLGVAKFLLMQRGSKGDRALLVADNGFFWVATYLGMLRAGVACVPLPTSTSSEDLEYIIGLTEARFVFAQARFAVKNAAAVRGLVLVTDSPAPPETGAINFAGLLASGAASDVVPLPRVHPDDLAALMFTSGSTARPRGVMISHGNIVANTDSIIQYLGLTASDRMMTILPFHYCFGTSLLHSHLRAGGTLVIDRRFMFPEKVLQRMRQTECTGFAGVPSHFQILLRRSGLRTMSFPHLRYMQQAGGHLAPTFIRELRAALPGTQIFVMYGQTEATARLSYLPPEVLEQKTGSIGRAIPGVRLEVLDEAGRPVAPAEIGEIVAEGKNIAQGYWRAGQETADTFRDGKLHTGDLARVDEDGFIYVVDRAKDFLKCGGKRISCRQIEEMLLEFDGLLEAAVIGVADETLGEAVKAFVVPRDRNGASFENQLRMFCKQRMPASLIPRELVVLDSLPKNSAGKVLKPALKAL